MKSFYVLVLALSAASLASAGQVEIGQSSSGGISTLGLTSTYINSVTQTAGWAEKIFSTSVFSGDTITGSSLNGVAETTAVGTGGTSTTPTTANGFQQFTDPNNNIVFAMDADGSDNYWASDSGTGTGATSIIIPVGVASVYGANLLLNDYWGVNGSLTQNDTILFSFNGGAITDSITLTNGNQIMSDQVCATASPSFLSVNCTTFAKTTGSGTDIAWSANYVNGTNNSTPYSGTSGSMNIADVSFNLSAYNGDTLTSITLTDNNNTINSSRLALEAVTVETGTPEPSTWILLVAGLGSVAFLGKRRNLRA